MDFGGNISHAQNVSFTEEIDIATLARNHHYFKVSMAINDYYGPLITVCGLLGNTLSFIVMSQVSLQLQSSNFFKVVLFFLLFIVPLNL